MIMTFRKMEHWFMLIQSCVIWGLRRSWRLLTVHLQTWLKQLDLHSHCVEMVDLANSTTGLFIKAAGMFRFKVFVRTFHEQGTECFLKTMRRDEKIIHCSKTTQHNRNIMKHNI